MMKTDERVKRGQSNGKYKANKPHGLTNAIHAAWYKPPNCLPRMHWSRMMVWMTIMRVGDGDGAWLCERCGCSAK
eukprot:1147330-Pelagomonas_calceolata.AAC.2